MLRLTVAVSAAPLILLVSTARTASLKCRQDSVKVGTICVDRSAAATKRGQSMTIPPGFAPVAK